MFYKIIAAVYLTQIYSVTKHVIPVFVDGVFLIAESGK
jgi:hypothetical protein